jgi:hypothetical protein
LLQSSKVLLFLRKSKSSKGGFTRPVAGQILSPEEKGFTRPVAEQILAPKGPGFIDAEGCFNIHVFQNTRVKLGQQVKLRFIVDQKIVDQDIGNYFGGGKLYYYSNDCAQIVISKQKLIFNKIIPFFQENSLLKKMILIIEKNVQN